MGKFGRCFRKLFSHGDKVKKTTRPIHMIVIHCAATSPSMDIGRDEIDSWHKERGWNEIGYHYVIRRDGTLEDGRDISKIGAHVKGFNTGSVGICLVGGVDAKNRPKDNFTPEQWKRLAQLVRSLKAAYPITTIYGHRDLDDKKACPSYDVKAWLEREGL